MTRLATIAADNQRLLRAALREDLGTFVAKVFGTISPADTYVDNWHIDAIVHQLRHVFHGDSRRLIITQPPRSLKSICTSVALAAWWLGHDPRVRFVCASYSLELAATLQRQFRTVIDSDWYRSLFPDVHILKDDAIELVTTMGGGRAAVTVGGSFTGRGADVIIVDDPIKASEAQSDAARRTVNEWFSGTLVSRLNDKQTGRIILTMQRLHEDDLAGMLLRQGGWIHLNLPAIAEEDQEIEIGPRVTHVFRKGEPLQPVREPLETLERIKRDMGSLAYSAQYLQRPVPLEGNLVKRGWIEWYEILPAHQPGAQIVQSWDVASTTSVTSDWSVCTTWLVAKRDYHLLDVWRGRLEFPSLRQQLIKLAADHRPNSILIEEAGAGLHLLQELRVNPQPRIPRPLGIRPSGDKIVRMEAQCARFEAGQVHLPKDAPWLGEFLHEILGFPYSRHDDQVDSASQFLNWAEQSRSFRRTVSCAAPIIIRG